MPAARCATAVTLLTGTIARGRHGIGRDYPLPFQQIQPLRWKANVNQSLGHDQLW